MSNSRHLTWDTALPTAAGLYLFEGVANFGKQSLHLNPHAIVVADTEDIGLVTTLLGYVYPISILDGKWQGPILFGEVTQ